MTPPTPPALTPETPALLPIVESPPVLVEQIQTAPIIPKKLLVRVVKAVKLHGKHRLVVLLLRGKERERENLLPRC